MNKEKIYLCAGVVCFQVGACSIHWGLGLMVLGAWLVVCAFFEYDKEFEDEEEE